MRDITKLSRGIRGTKSCDSETVVLKLRDDRIGMQHHLKSVEHSEALVQKKKKKKVQMMTSLTATLQKYS